MTAESATRRGLVDAFAFFFLGAMAFALPWDVFQRIPYVPLTVVKVAGGLIVVLAGPLFYLGRRDLPQLRLVEPITVFTMGCIFSMVGAAAPDTSALVLLLFAGYGVFLFAGASFCDTVARSRLLLRAYYGAAVAVAMVTFLCKAGVLWPTDWKPTIFPYGGSLLALAQSGVSMRMAAASPDLNQGALLLAVAFSVGTFVWDWRGTGVGRRVMFVMCQAALVGAIVIAQSRSALGALAALTILLLGSMVWRRSRSGAVVAGMVCVLALIALWQWPPVREWVLREDDSVSSRTWAYRAAWALILDWPMGVGLGASDGVIAASEFGEEVDGMAVHNVPLKLALEIGVIGFAGYVLIWAAIAVTLGRAALRADGEDRRGLARAGLAAVFVILCMQMVQPFVALPVYPFLLAVVLGPLTDRHAADARNRSRADTGLVVLPAVLVAGLVCVNVWQYQRSMSYAEGVAQFIDQSAEARLAGASVEAEDSLRYAELLAGHHFSHTFSDVISDVGDFSRLFEPWGLLLESPRPETGIVFALSSAALARGDLAGAKAELERVIAANPEFAQAHFLLGEVYAALGNQDAASREFKLATGLEDRRENWGFRQRMELIDERIYVLSESDDPLDQEERQYWLEKRVRRRTL